MPPRRVLPIRSRVDNTSSQPRAGGDGTVKPPDSGAGSSMSAGGSSSGATSPTGQLPEPESHIQTGIDESKPDHQGEVSAADTNGMNNLKDDSKDSQGMPLSGHDGKEDVMVSAY